MAVNSTSHTEAVKPPRLQPMERVRKRVKDAVASGDIVDWKEASKWFRQAREEDGERGYGDDYARLLMRKLFDQVARAPGSEARVVGGRGGLDSAGDGRRAHLLLFSLVVPDQLVVDLYLSVHGENSRANGVHLKSAEGKE